MNQKAEVISSYYKNMFSTGFNHYLQVREQLSYIELNSFKDALWKVGMLVEIWSYIEAQQKEKRHG